MRPKNVILLEIMIIVTKGMMHHGGRGTVCTVVIVPTRFGIRCTDELDTTTGTKTSIDTIGNKLLHQVLIND
jgi:hypothetical protein